MDGLILLRPLWLLALLPLAGLVLLRLRRLPDAGAGRVSVLAPVGASLLGLAVGQRIDWPGVNGRTLRLRVLAVAPPAA